jgi:amino acid transporter
LQQSDPRYVGLLVLLSVAVCSAVRKKRRGKWPSANHFGRGVAAAVFITSGFFVFVIFMLTRPPAVELLPGESHMLIGMFTLIFVVGIGWHELRRLFFDRNSDSQDD